MWCARLIIISTRPDTVRPGSFPLREKDWCGQGSVSVSRVVQLSLPLLEGRQQRATELNLMLMDWIGEFDLALSLRRSLDTQRPQLCCYA